MKYIVPISEKPGLTIVGDNDLHAKTLAYLATPYTNYPDGIEIAFREASSIAAQLLKLSIETYSPIAHCHPMAIYGDLDALDRDFWLRYQENMMGRCDVLIVAEMKSWEQSHGVAHEIRFFENVRKPIFQLNLTDMILRIRPYSRSLAHNKTQSEHAGSSV